MRLQGKKIILGISGSIAAFKSVFLLRLLIKEGAQVQVVITPSGKEFVTPVTLSALSGRPVISEFFGKSDGTWHSHVDLGLWADAMLVAPATAATLGKMANGIADNMLITTYMSAKCPVYIAPAMDLDMFVHPSTQRNIDILKSYGNVIIDPAVGELASGLEGKGRMQEPEKMVDMLAESFSQKKNC
jgi:phosphopantothenoylcysteine synthetase/decarboxylase